MSIEALCCASPSLALIKYWGKKSGRRNLPATASLAVTLGGLYTRTRVILDRQDSVTLDGVVQDPARFKQFFDRLRQKAGRSLHFRVESKNDFPTSAGLASSSSGFAALAVGCTRAAGLELDSRELSGLARLGSASAARSLFGGFTLLQAGAREARQLYGSNHWPELRIAIVLVSREVKPISSRRAMEATRTTSPYYRAWLRSASGLLEPAVEALRLRDLNVLGSLARLSYARMHAALLASDPPLLYWLPATVAVIRECGLLREQGIGAWETLDAGPQVKILCLEPDLPRIRERITALDPELKILVASPGEGANCRVRG